MHRQGWASSGSRHRSPAHLADPHAAQRLAQGGCQGRKVGAHLLGWRERERHGMPNWAN